MIAHNLGVMAFGGAGLGSTAAGWWLENALNFVLYPEWSNHNSSWVYTATVNLRTANGRNATGYTLYDLQPADVITVELLQVPDGAGGVNATVQTSSRNTGVNSLWILYRLPIPTTTAYFQAFIAKNAGQCNCVRHLPCAVCCSELCCAVLRGCVRCDCTLCALLAARRVPVRSPFVWSDHRSHLPGRRSMWW